VHGWCMSIASASSHPLVAHDDGVIKVSASLSNMTWSVLAAFTNTRRPFIDQYLRQTGIELMPTASHHVASDASHRRDDSYLVHRLLVVYLKQCLSHENPSVDVGDDESTS
jgi:hypothetical protein